MAIFGAITALLPLIEKLIPDKDAREKATAELNRLDQAGELRVMLAQIATNLSEGRHASMFVAGWRPMVGWICAVALANNFLIVPYVGAFTDAVQPLDMGVMMPILMGMLGLGGMRTWERLSGKARQRIKESHRVSG